MDYLLHSLKGAAHAKVKGLGIDGSAYTEAVQILQNNYSNPVLQRRALWDKLHNLTAVRDNLSNLEYFTDELRSTIIAMKQQNIDDVALTGYVPEIMKKLPQSIILELSRMRIMKGQTLNEVSIKDIMDILQMQFQLCSLANPRQPKRQEVERVPEKRQWQTQGRNGPMQAMIVQQAKQTPSYHQQTNSGSGTTVRACVFCKSAEHYSDDCLSTTSVQARRSMLANDKRCFKCLGTGHRISECKRKKVCFHCKSPNHHSALCPNRNVTDANQMVSMVNESDGLMDAGNDITDEIQVHLNEAGKGDGIVMAAFPCKVVNMETKKVCELLVYADGGCRRTCISSQAATKLGLMSKRDVKLQVARFNSNSIDDVNAQVVEVGLCGIDGKQSKVNGFCVPKTSPPMKVGPIELSKQSARCLRKLKPVNLPPKYQKQYETIDILLGQDYYNSFFGPQIKATKVQNELYVYHTKLGNVLCGNSKQYATCDEETQVFQNMLCTIQEDPVEQLWKLETIGITEDPKAINNKHEEVMQRFVDNVKTLDNGRYEVGFPWKKQPAILSSNFRLAKQRLRTTVLSLQSRGTHAMESYDAIIKEQLRNSIVEEIQPTQRDGPLVHYVAHFPVVRTDKATTKVRIVYDASVPTKAEKKSLNDLIYTGPCMLNDLTGVLLRFRMYEIPLIADIEKAFLQVALKLEDRDATRFLWVKDVKKPMEEPGNLLFLRFARLPFGIVASPHLLGATVRYHLQQYDGELKHQILRDLYVDNTIMEAKTTDEAVTMFKEARKMFDDAGMNLREWSSSNKEFNDLLPKEERAGSNLVKVLGVEWNTSQDLIKVLYNGNSTNQMNKRQLLSAIASVFDPLGLFVPVTVLPRILMQDVWKKGLDWNDKLPTNIHRQWNQYEQELKKIPAVQIQRKASDGKSCRNVLVSFTDASQVAYGLCIYLCQQLPNGQNNVNLVFAKARVAPLKPLMTIPKLELTAVLLGCRALRFVMAEINVKVDKLFLFTDSQIVLSWLKTEKALTPYVERRRHEILARWWWCMESTQEC